MLQTSIYNVGMVRWKMQIIEVKVEILIEGLEYILASTSKGKKETKYI